MVLPRYSNNVAPINYMFWHAEVFYTILPDTFAPFVSGIQNHSQILRPSWWGLLNNLPQISIFGYYSTSKSRKSPPVLSRKKKPGGRLQPAVSFIDIFSLLDYMQMKWAKIWFLARYKTIWTWYLHPRNLFRTKKKWWPVRYNRNCLFFFLKFSVAFCIFLVCRCSWPDCLQE